MIRRAVAQSHSYAALLLFCCFIGAVVASGCGDDDPTRVASSKDAVPAYQAPGPYPVGLMTLDLVDRKVAVFYPAVPGSEAGQQRIHYRQTDPIYDTFLKGIAENLARRRNINLDYQMRVYGDLPAANGRFPVLLFSHGFGGWRLVNSNLLQGIASWGFIVASADHIERDLNAVATMTVDPDRTKDRAVLLAELQLLRDENVKVGGRLQGRVDSEHVGAAGHSAGGAAVLSLIDEPQIDAIVGYASVGSVSNPPSKPVMLISAANDIAVTPDTTRVIFDALRAPKRFLVMDQVGHNTFTDTCDAIRSGATLTQLARDAGIPISEQLLALAENGCEPTSLAPAECWAITQHLTVAHLRQAFGIDRSPVGLGAGIADAFVVPVSYVDVQ